MATIAKNWSAATAPSASVEWGTPPDLFAQLHARHGFTVDAAASDANALLPRYWTRESDGLAQSWRDERVWVNPPFGRGVAAWTSKARRETAAGGCPLVVMLIPARTDTAWWHDDVLPHAAVTFLRGRVRYVRDGCSDAAPFPSAIVTWRGFAG